MNKLEADVIRVCKQLTERPGRACLVLCAENDGVNPRGVIYALHAGAAGDVEPTLKTCMESITAHTQRGWQYLTHGVYATPEELENGGFQNGNSHGKEGS